MIPRVAQLHVELQLIDFVLDERSQNQSVVGIEFALRQPEARGHYWDNIPSLSVGLFRKINITKLVLFNNYVLKWW